MIKKLIFVSFGLAAAVAGFYLSLNLKSDFETVEGESYQWQDFNGQFLVVNYFAEWCAPCLKEIPELNQFERFADGETDVALLAVNFDNLPTPELLALKQKYQIDFRIISGLPENTVFSKPKSLPTTFIIGPDGALIKQLQGEQSDASLQNIIIQLRQRQLLQSS
ncbi:TlpA disulfide reductase family protein [Aliiglaciecola sp. 3_MG-2023]|uniref:TlpA family protein disulfide reductase n=1 Tax=Aliiglaciecola sp. 3_MG-2023 TaxID=3062644 RepID=UPI0026E1C1CC|nr:TlpA disulfide reductase family protein [Aliiglaciecola sp. 3_MG-2023]MDO6693714.1 TlpA disulfide reductase family protein [Aliiglaciecola sp. 3_MG-2023]